MYPTKKLSEVVNTIRGITYKPDQLRSKEEGIACFRTKNIQDALDEDDIYYVDPSILRNNDKILETGDILISSANSLEQLGKCCLIQNLDYKATLGGFICAMRPNKDILNYKYFYLYFSSNKIQKKVRTFSKKTTGIANLQLKDVENLQIPLPPLSTQSKIVAKLDEAFDNIDHQISLLKANIEDVENMRKSALSELFSGNYQIKKLQEVCEKITDGTHQTPTYFNSGYIFLSSKNVTSGKIDWNNIKYIDERQHQEMYKRVAPRKGDILLAKNGTTGVAAIVDRNEIFDIYVSLALIRPKDEIISEYLWYFINSSEAKRQFNSRLKGVGVPNLHLGEIKEVDIPLPPLPRQHEIVEHLDRVFTQTAELRSSYETQIRDLETLRQSLLEEAFAGRLVSE